MAEEKNESKPTPQGQEAGPDMPELTKESQEGESPQVQIEEEPAQEPSKEPTELERLSDDLAAITDKYLRLAAEYDNFRKRSLRERETIYPDAMAAAATIFLTVADNLERALAAPCADAEYKKGTEMTYKSLLDAFSRLHIEPFGAPGDLFDPALHNAVMHVEDETAEQSAVTEVFAKGYRIGDRILRCAMVKVAN